MNPEHWSRVKDLFLAALDQEPGAQPAFLDSACGSDSALRAEVERLLAAHRDAGTFIDASPADAWAPSGPPLEAMTGRVMGHYEIGRLIGVGGMGAVYAAHDVDLGRAVALKVVTTETLDAQSRLRREAQQASQLNHPHICTVHEVGAVDGQAYFAMEYVEGRTLSELAAQAVPIESALRYGIQIADAVAHAHERGIVHRDLKSANVMVTPDGHVKVLDFGLACSLPPPRLTEMTRATGRISEDRLLEGTLPYMAPELLRGQPADVRSDIWALGVMLYEMAAGHRPFEGATGPELSAAILHQPPAPFPARVPALLTAIIGRCLTKDRHERYGHAGEVRSALEAVRSDVIGTAAQTLPAPRRDQRTSWPLALSAALAIVLALGLAWVWMRPATTPVGVGTSGRPAVAVMTFDNVTGTPDTAWLSTGVPTMLLTGLAQTQGLEIVSTQGLHNAIRQLGLEGLDSLNSTQVTTVARRAGAGAVVVGSIVRSGTEIRIDARLEDLSTGRVLVADTVRGDDVFTLVDQLAVRIREGVGFGDAADVRKVIDVSTRSLDAYRLYSQALDAFDAINWDDAESLLQQAVSIDPGFAEAHLRLAVIYRLLGQEIAWRDNVRQAAENAGRLNERQRLLLAVDLARVEGNAAEAARRIDEVLAKFPDADEAYYIAFQLYGPFGGVHDPEKSLRIRAQAVEARPSAAGLRNNYGYALLEADRYTDALREFEVYVRLAPRDPNPHDSLGEAYLYMGNPEKAIEAYSRTLTVDPRFVNGHNGRAWAMAMLGRYDEAIAENAPDRSINAYLLSRVGRYAEAEKVLNAGLLDAAVKRSISTRGGFSLLLALFALERRDYPRARQELRRAAEAYAQMPGPDLKPYLVLMDSLTGTLDLAQQRPDAARARLDAVKRRYNPAVVTENWWAHALEGDLALATGRVQDAADAYAAGEPPVRMWLSSLMPAMSLVSNNLPSRDGPARVAAARGDIAGALEAYRRLTSPNAQQKWNGMFEPRYVLEIARLLDRAGDRRGADAEYRRFLDLWRNADPGLPELAEARRAIARSR